MGYISYMLKSHRLKRGIVGELAEREIGVSMSVEYELALFQRVLERKNRSCFNLSASQR